MSIKVPFLTEERIERDAEALLAEFENKRSTGICLPIPIEDIVEKHLKLRVEFDDLHQSLGVPRSGGSQEPDILGAIFFGQRRIVIDETLDPVENPSKEGRYPLPSRMREADIGGCIAIYSRRTRRRPHCWRGGSRLRWCVVRAERKSPSNGRRITTPGAC
jgi:hypothetical protein